MRTGNNGQAVITWTQTEIDGLEDAPLGHVVVGSAWSWCGRAVQLNAEHCEASGRAMSPTAMAELVSWVLMGTDQTIPERARIEISNGAQKFVARLATVFGEMAPVLVFENGCPEPGQEFWISAAADNIEPVSISRAEDRRVIAFPSAVGHVQNAASDRAVFAAE